MMKLSEAIRLGAMLHPQAFGMLEVWEHDMLLKTCALGAAKQAGYDIHERESPTCGIPCPHCGPDFWPDRLYSVVTHLNDVHHWSREQIADWVEGIEQEHASPATVDAVDPQVHPQESGTRA